MLGFIILCSKEFKDPYVIKALYCSLVRPILEFLSGLWCSYYRVQVSRIELIQKKFLQYALRNLVWRNSFVLPRPTFIDSRSKSSQRVGRNFQFVEQILGTWVYREIRVSDIETPKCRIQF